IFNSFYTINEQEAAVVTTFGIASSTTESGLHFKIPFVQQVTKVDTTIKGFPIGYDAHTNNAIEDESLMITSDFNFVNVDFYVEYRVTDPVKALYASENYEAVLKTIAQSSIRAEIGSYPVDSVITTGKSEIQANIKEKITQILDRHDIGINLINITIQDAEPPTAEVLEAFMNVESAKQGAETAVNNANKYRNEQIPAAEAEVDQILKEAESTKEARVNEAQGQASRFNEIYNEYKKYPLITKQRMFYEAMEELLPDLKVIIDGSDGGTEKILPIEPLISTGTLETVE
ncbi:MAG: FtsH protease activity modulator HflK, partial [Lachnospiraceae bacterium]|nr:FtsH protease activity modulator HflK [Lachnospiraceae bacterium]